MASLVGESDSAAGASAGEHAWTRERPPMYFGSVYQSKLLKLRALVLSGVYGNVEMIKSLNAYMLEHNLSADFVVIAGGLVRPTLSKHSSPVSAEATTSTLGDSATVLSAIEKIMCRIFYVPSDTDSAACFAALKKERLELPLLGGLVPGKAPRLSPHSHNIHGRSLLLKPEGMVFVGLGGSVGGGDTGHFENDTERDEAFFETVQTLRDPSKSNKPLILVTTANCTDTLSQRTSTAEVFCSDTASPRYAGDVMKLRQSGIVHLSTHETDHAAAATMESEDIPNFVEESRVPDGHVSDIPKKELEAYLAPLVLTIVGCDDKTRTEILLGDSFLSAPCVRPGALDDGYFAMVNFSRESANEHNWKFMGADYFNVYERPVAAAVQSHSG